MCINAYQSNQPLHDHTISQLIRHITKILFFTTFPLFSPTASRELQSGGVRLNDLSVKLLRALEKKDQPQPQAQFTGVLSDQLDRLRQSNRDHNPY